MTMPNADTTPDPAFVARERRAQFTRRGYAPLAPDAIVEIVSPDDSPGKVLAKISAWLDAGVRRARVVDPERSTAQLYRPDGSVSLVAAYGMLEGEDVLPGFTCMLADIPG